MHKRVFLSGIAALILLPLLNTKALAQHNAPKVDVGAQFSVIRFRDLDTTDAGVGGRITYNITDLIALEGEVNFFPRNGTDFFESGRKTQALFGIKTGFRSSGAGIFAKVRPGFIHFSRDFDGFSDGHTDFALDVGSVIELYPSKRTLVRFDVGDTIIRFGDRIGPLGPIGGFTSHNFQFSAGFGVRF